MSSVRITIGLVATIIFLDGCGGSDRSNSVSECRNFKEYYFGADQGDLTLNGSNEVIVNYKFYPLTQTEISYYSVLNEQLMVGSHPNLVVQTPLVLPMRKSTVVKKIVSKEDPIEFSLGFTMSKSVDTDGMELKIRDLAKVYFDEDETLSIGITFYPKTACDYDSFEGYSADRLLVRYQK
jgi:hypothetical protein